MPSLHNRSRAAEPKASAPKTPRKITCPPARAAATASFAPFPPPNILNSPPSTVSPGLGRRSQNTTRSVFELPTMRILGLGAMSFIRRAIKTKKDHPVKPVGIVNRSHLGFSAANFSAGSYNSVAIQQWLFSGSGDCPARPQLLAVGEGYTKRLSEPDQKAQSPSCGLQNRADRFPVAATVRLGLSFCQSVRVRRST